MRMELFERIKWARETAHTRSPRKFSRPVSQTSVAKALGVTPQSVQQWELPPTQGGTAPRKERREKLAEYLEVDFVWLETGSGNAEGIPQIQETEPPYSVTLNRKALMMAIEFIQELESRTQKKLCPEEWAELIDLFYYRYDEYLKTGETPNQVDMLLDFSRFMERINNKLDRENP